MRWWSPISFDESKAVFYRYDKKGFPKEDAILIIGIGRKGHKKRHYFRWPLKYIRKVA